MNTPRLRFTLKTSIIAVAALAIVGGFVMNFRSLDREEAVQYAMNLVLAGHPDFGIERLRPSVMEIDSVEFSDGKTKRLIPCRWLVTFSQGESRQRIYVALTSRWDAKLVVETHGIPPVIRMTF